MSEVCSAYAQCYLILIPLCRTGEQVPYRSDTCALGASAHERSRPTDITQQQAHPPKEEPNVYNIVTDVAAGPNVRLKDNLLQAVFILASIAIAAGIGAFVAPEEVGPGWGAAMGGIVGLIAGALLSGGILMVYRLFKH